MGKGRKMSEFKPIETQEQFDAAVSDRIKRERETLSRKYENYLSPEQVQQQKIELEGKISDFTNQLNGANEKITSFEKTIAEKDKEIQGYKTASLKTKIAHEAGLDYGSVEFLKGDDEESIRHSAEALKSLIGTHQGAPKASTEDPNEKKEDAALKKVIEKLKNQED